MKDALNASSADALSVMQTELVRGLEMACNDIVKGQRLAASKGKAFKRSSYLKG
jgi:hypothetical protein